MNSWSPITCTTLHIYEACGLKGQQSSSHVPLSDSFPSMWFALLSQRSPCRLTPTENILEALMGPHCFEGVYVTRNKRKRRDEGLLQRWLKEQRRRKNKQVHKIISVLGKQSTLPLQKLFNTTNLPRKLLGAILDGPLLKVQTWAFYSPWDISGPPPPSHQHHHHRPDHHHHTVKRCCMESSLQSVCWS